MSLSLLGDHSCDLFHAYLSDISFLTTYQISSGETLISYNSNAQAVASLTQFLTSQEKNLSSGQRRGYFNLELRLLHHDCCSNLGGNGGKLMKPMKAKEDGQRVITGFGGLADYRAPIVSLDKKHIREAGFAALLKGPLKQSVSRQPLIHATDALARARLMFGTGSGGSGGDVVDSTARVVITIFTQMCNFYGQSYLYPILESLAEMINSNPPNSPPVLPFDETAKAHDLGIGGYSHELVLVVIYIILHLTSFYFFIIL